MSYIIDITYNRENVVTYAQKWAFERNSRYYDYSKLGGDCTNFASQCVYVGCGVMNYKKDLGWYYNNANNKSPSWTGVGYFYNFLTSNKSAGPYGEEVLLEQLLIGDVIQLGTIDGKFYHSLILTDIIENTSEKNYYVCAHSDDAYRRNLYSYNFEKLRGIHIIGARR